MAKQSAINNNKKRAKLAKRYANKRATLKAITQDKNATMEERFEATLKLAKLPRNSAPTRHRNRCELTGRPRGNYQKFMLSRNSLRELASIGQIPGMIKSSW